MDCTGPARDLPPRPRRAPLPTSRRARGARYDDPALPRGTRRPAVACRPWGHSASAPRSGRSRGAPPGSRIDVPASPGASSLRQPNIGALSGAATLGGHDPTANDDGPPGTLEVRADDVRHGAQDGFRGLSTERAGHERAGERRVGDPDVEVVHSRDILGGVAQRGPPEDQRALDPPDIRTDIGVAF